MDKLKIFNTFERSTKSPHLEGRAKKQSNLLKKGAKEGMSQDLAQKTLEDKANFTSKGKQLRAGLVEGHYNGDQRPLLRPQEVREGQKDKKDSRPTSDIGPNHPDNPVTQEKLKSILRSGAFSFNEKERNVLAEILNSSKS